MHLRPFRLSTIHPTERRGLFADGRGYRIEAFWQDLGGVDARTGEDCQVRFARVCGRGTWMARSVSRDFSHLSDQYSAVLTKSESLEVFSVSIRRHDTILSMDLRSGYNHFRLLPAMRYYFVVSVKLMDGTVRYFRYLVLPFG
jgi:hypothetical protein